MTCARCGHAILPGQIYRLWGSLRPAHVACPSERQIRQAKLWGRWT
jgi:hypothetical protein